MAVSITKGNETIIFAWQGKTMIGKIITSKDKTNYDVDTATDSIIGTLIDKIDDYYIIHNPCEIQFSIETPAQGTAELQWVLKPYYYKHLIADGGVTHSPFAFKKDDVALSNIGGTTIHPDILAAYKELVGV
jgi:hypothetical protein